MHPDKQRLSIGIYDDPLSVLGPLGDLLDIGVPLDRIGLVASQGTIESLMRNPLVSLGARRLLERISGDTVSIGCGCGLAAPVASRSIAALVQDGAEGCWARLLQPMRSSREGQADDIDQHVRLGRTALAVSSATQREQWRAAKILLESSNYPVETHEFWPVAATKPEAVVPPETEKQRA